MKTMLRLALVVSVAVAALLKTQAVVDDESPLAARALPLLYVANAGFPGFVTAYDPGSCGSVAPLLAIRGANTLINDDQSLAFDPSGNLLVQNFISEAMTLVFAPKASGNVAPSRFFGTGERDKQSIAVDSKGYVFIVCVQGHVMEVIAPGASGTVSPLRTISFDGYPISVAVDDEDNVIVGVEYSGSNLDNAIEVFGPQVQEGSPKRIIRGSNTGLGGNDSTVPIVAFSPVNDRIYVGVSTPNVGQGTPPKPNAHVSVFPSDGNGNISPVRTISGTLTGLNGTSIQGLAGNPQTGEVFVLTTPFTPGPPPPGSIIVFARLANGNVLPLRSFTDSNTDLVFAYGIAFSPPR